MVGQKRAANFTDKEESLLISLVKKYKTILECKQSNTNIQQQKTACWIKIENEFNGVNDSFRNQEVLKKKYENIKKRAKKKFADEKLHRTGTGGGPPREEKTSTIDEEVREILGVRIQGMDSEFDGDATFCSVPTLSETNQCILESDGINTNEEDLVFEVPEDLLLANEKNQESKDSPSTSKVFNDTVEHRQSGNWTKYSGESLRQKKSKALTPKLKDLSYQKINSKISQWTEAKSALEETKRKGLEEEIAVKLKNLEEKHKEEVKIMRQKAEVELKLMKDESEQKMRLLKEEHDLKKDILLIQKNKMLTK